jgi:septal ring factor EnvC (AmiA/AmiB activator)
MSLDNEKNTNSLTLEIKSLTSEINMLHKMLSEKDSLVININIKLLNMEDQMKQLVEQNNNMETQLSRLMSYLVSFAVDVKDKLHYIKYK